MKRGGVRFCWAVQLLIGLLALRTPTFSSAQESGEQLTGCWVAAATGGDPVSIRPDNSYTWGSRSGRWAVHGEELWLLDDSGSGGVKWHYVLSADSLTFDRPEDFTYLGGRDYLYFQMTSPELTHRLTRALSPGRCRADEAVAANDGGVAARPRVVLPLGEHDALIEITLDDSGSPNGVRAFEDPAGVVERIDLISVPGTPPLIALETVQDCGGQCRWWFFEAFAVVESTGRYELEPAGDRFRIGVQDSDMRRTNDGGEVICLLKRHESAQLDSEAARISLSHQFELSQDTATREVLVYSSISGRLEAESSTPSQAPLLQDQCPE